MSCQSLWPWRGQCTVSGRPKPSCRQELGDQAAASQIWAEGSWELQDSGVGTISAGRQQRDRQTLTHRLSSLTYSKVTGLKGELFPGDSGRKGKECQGWGGNRQDLVSISLAWRLKTHTLDTLRVAYPL